MKAVLAAAILCGLALAGCSGTTTTTTSYTTRPNLEEGKGAIAGLLIDDVFRPIPGALVLAAKAGLTATTDASGQFQLVNLDPGSYILQVQAEGHASAPRSVEVKANLYEEVQMVADRLANAGGRTVTTEYSVFIPCAASVPAASTNVDCTFDGSGDSFRSSFESNYTGYQNVTYLVTEMLANVDASPEHGAYKVVVRKSTGGDPYFASKFIVEGRYMKLTMKFNATSSDDTEARNKPWKNDMTMQTALFPQGAFKGESQGGLDAECQATNPYNQTIDPLPDGKIARGCWESRGLGPQAGVRAKFVQTLFIGEPPGNIDDYGVLRPA